MMPRIADDYDSIRSRLAELRGGGNDRDEYYRNRVAAIPKRLRAEAAMATGGYAIGAAAKAAADAGIVELVQRQLEQFARQIDPSYKAQQRLDGAVRLLQCAIDTGAISPDQRAQIMRELQERYGRAAGE